MDVSKFDDYLEKIRDATTDPTVLRVVGEIELLLIEQGQADEEVRKEEAAKAQLPKPVARESHFSATRYRTYAERVRTNFTRKETGPSPTIGELSDALDRAADYFDAIDASEDPDQRVEVALRRKVANLRKELREEKRLKEGWYKWAGARAEDIKKLEKDVQKLKDRNRELRTQNSKMNLE